MDNSLSTDLANESNLAIVGGGHDPLGSVYKIENTYVRVIHQHMERVFAEMVNVGLLDRLFSEKLIPQYSIREITFNGKKRQAIFVDKINSPAVSEWSSAMFRDAILTILKVVKISAEFGYTLIDGHLNNVLFTYSTPIFIDLGSFIKSDDPKFWLASGEFRAEALTPYFLIRKGYGNAVRSFFTNPNSIAIDRLWIYRYTNYFKMLRILRLDSQLVKIQERTALIGVRNFGNGIMHLASRTSEEIIEDVFYNKFTFRNRVIVVCSQLGAKFLRRIVNIHPSSLIKRLHKYNANGPDGYWTKYYELEPEYERLQVIAESCKSFSINSITDLGGNDGSFINHLIELGVIKTGLCLDFDEASINRGYTQANTDGKKIGFAIYNAADPLIPKGANESRFTSDAVISLALMHHLVIRFRVTFEEYVKQIESLGSEYAFIEFMPLGLWDGLNAPNTPEGYSEENFLNAFTRVYEVLNRVVISENRLLFVGKKLPQNE
jgi:hypothetical protein